MITEAWCLIGVFVVIIATIAIAFIRNNMREKKEKQVKGYNPEFKSVKDENGDGAPDPPQNRNYEKNR